MWCHWPVPADVVARRLPPSLTPDLYEGRAWVGFVPFEMQALRLVVAGRDLPAVPTTENFSEVNVRTYVRGPMGPGVWFDTLDASSRLGAAVARLAWSLPYVPSRIESDASDGPGARDWRVSRADGATGRLRTEVGAARPEQGPLETFLTERYALYARAWWSRHRSLWAPVAHPPWRLRSCAGVEVDAGLVREAGYDVSDEPAHVVASDSVDVQIGLPRLTPRDAGHPTRR